MLLAPACPRTAREIKLGSLRESIRNNARAGFPRAAAVNTGWPLIDAALPHQGLARGMVHEWLGLAQFSYRCAHRLSASGGDPSAGASIGDDRLGRWIPPISLLMHLAAGAHASGPGMKVVWIGQQTWPYPPALQSRMGVMNGAGGVDLLGCSLFVRAFTAVDRVWAIDLALRSGAVSVVIADGSGLNLAGTRRLQLAAEAGHALCLIARPSWERDMPSAAGTRWAVSACGSSGSAKRWTVELLRCKGMQPAAGAARLWTLEQSHATRAVDLVADMVNRPGVPKTAARARRTA